MKLLTLGAWIAAAVAAVAAARQGEGTRMDKPGYEVAAYYWPNWHADARNEARLGRGWTEWELSKAARPRFPGHVQPRVPLWGYEDEADPQVMARKIDAAAGHGITAFIFDWYYYNEGIALERCLHEGFLKAPNRGRLKFGIMWANHDYVDIFPAKVGKPKALWNAGEVTRETFVKATDLMIREYFPQPNYWRVDGRPYFSIYELHTLMQGLGGADKTRAALADFRARCTAAGLPGLHINAVAWGIQGESADRFDALGIDSVTSYVWVHHVGPASFPSYPYEQWGDAAVRQWPELQARFRVPYHPNVSVGWDSTPRTDQAEEFRDAGYPHMAAIVGGTPQAFRRYLEQAKAYLDGRPAGQRILTINSWNEWTEGSYLEPDTLSGMEYLDAVKAVFPPGRI